MQARLAEAEGMTASDGVLASLTTDLLDGHGISTGELATFDVVDPATERVIARVPDHSIDVALQTVGLADAAGREWSRTTPRHRSDVLSAVYSKFMENKDRLALLITREMGKPLAEAYGEVQYASDFVRWYAEEGLRPGGAYRDAPSGGASILTRRGPIGLSLLITPWNFPMAMATRKVAPALAAGCSTIIKPAALTPLTTLLVAELMYEAGVPRGLVNVVTTEDAAGFSAAVMNDERVRKVSFTGSTGVGKVLMAQAARNVMKSSMELGGNAPFLVFDDADLERAVDGAVLAKLRNGGQSCVAANRFLVQDGIADAFVEGFSERMKAIVSGGGFDKNVTLGPVIDDRAVARLTHLVDDALDRGARLTAGGTASARAGYFFDATVLDFVPPSADIASTEIFGPVAAVTRFRTQDEAIRRANDTPFGLAGYVFTESLDRALNVADLLETGMVGINQGVPSNVAAPFGGVKQSGLGREGSGEGLEEYQEVRFYNIARRTTG